MTNLAHIKIHPFDGISVVCREHGVVMHVELEEYDDAVAFCKAHNRDHEAAVPTEAGFVVLGRQENEDPDMGPSYFIATNIVDRETAVGYAETRRTEQARWVGGNRPEFLIARIELEPTTVPLEAPEHGLGDGEDG